MNVLVAGLGDIGAPLAVRALARDHMVTGLDTVEDHAYRLEWLKTPLTEKLTQPWQTLREMEHHGHYEQLYKGDEVPEFDVAIVTPNCMVNDAPHLRWTRFEREMRMIGKKLRKGNLVILHCLSLQGQAMMQDAENILWHASGMVPDEDYCLVWTGLLNGEYQTPETQDLFVDGMQENCTIRARDLLNDMVASAVSLHDLEKTEEPA